MVKLKSLILLLPFLLMLPVFASATQEEDHLLSELKTFQWAKLSGETAPCASYECHLIWAAPAMAIGDLGLYARRVKLEGMQQYAKEKGIHQDFDAVSKLESLAPMTPAHFHGRYQIQIKNQASRTQNEPTDLEVESRVVIQIAVNGVATDVIFDSGASLSLPTDAAAVTTLHRVDVPANNAGALGVVSSNALLIAKEVAIGNAVLKNQMVITKENVFKQGIQSLGLLGYDFLLRFDAVNVDLLSGVIQFNPATVERGYCAPMELALDKSRIPAGLATDILIDDIPFKARIDTGANVDVLLHGKDLMPWKKGKPLRVLGVDTAGLTTPLEEFAAHVTLGTTTSTHAVVRTPIRNETFDATLGIKFFAGHSLTFDFRHSQFCMD